MFWKKTKKIFSNFKRQGSDRIKIPSTQEICRSQSDYAIDSLKLYEKQLEQLNKNNAEDSQNNTAKQRPLSLFIQANDESDEDSECSTSTFDQSSRNSTDHVWSSNTNTYSGLIKTSNSNKDSLLPQLHIRINSKVKWTDFSVSDLHNFLMILQREEEVTRSAVINRYKYLSKQISLRLKLMKT